MPRYTRRSARLRPSIARGVSSPSTSNSGHNAPLREHTNALIAILDQHGTIIHRNAAYRRALDTSTAHIGTSLFDLIHPDDLAAVRNQWALLAQQTPLQTTFRQRASDGAWHKLEVQAERIPSNDTYQVLLIAHDVTERVDSEAEQGRLATLVEQQREHFRAILASVPGVVWEAWGKPDATTQQIDFVSDYVETMLGYSVQEWQQTPNFWLTIVHPDDRERAAREAAAAFTRGKGGITQFRWVARDGRVLWVEAQSTVICDATGTPVGMRGVTMDITERKRAEQALREQREWFAVTLGSIGDAVIATDATGRIMFMNPMAEKLTGWHHDQAIGLDSGVVFRTLDAVTDQPADLPIAEVIRTGAALELAQQPLITRDGTLRAIDHSAAPIRGTDNTVVGVVLVFRDVTERIRVEAQQRLLVKASSVLAASLDYETTLDTVANLVIGTLADWCIVDILEDDNTPQRLVLAHHDPAKVELAQALHQRYPLGSHKEHLVLKVLQSGQPVLVSEISHEWQINGEYDNDYVRMVRELGLRSCICVPLIARDRVLGALTFITDGTSRRYDRNDLLLAEELASRAALAVDNARLYREAQAAVRTRDDFLSIAAHELKNPLTSMLGYTQTLLRRTTREQPYTLTERDHEWLQVIAAQTKRLHSLMEDLLSVGRFQAGRLSVQRKVMDICGFVRRVVTELEPVLEQHTLDYTGWQEELLINGDQQGLEEVLQNLLQNAIKYSPRGGRIMVEVARQLDQVAISIADQGIGIPTDALPHLFQPFYRVSSCATAAIKGTGIGLYVVKEIVSLHGGSIEVQSEECRGSTFTVRLPLHQIEP